MATMGDEMPRAKRLKMLREAKERKERIERGEAVEEIGAGVESVVIDKHKERDASEESSDQEHDDNKSNESAVVEQPQGKEDEAEEEGEEEDESELLNLAPKRANWDIERDIAPMLKKLEKRTQYSIVEILRKLPFVNSRLQDFTRCNTVCKGLMCLLLCVVGCVGEKLAAEQEEEGDEDEEEEDEEEEDGQE